MSKLVLKLRPWFYQEPSNTSFVSQLLDRVRNCVNSDSVVLDIGAGAGLRNTYDFRGKVRRMIGLDIDERVSSNPLLDEGIVSAGEHIPLKNHSVDVIFCIYVLEHIENPTAFCAEVFRVLKPGGKFIALTPNQFHYVPVIARLTPHWFHQWINKKRGRQEADTFPTYYRLNSRRCLRRYFSRFHSIEFVMLEGCPEYLKFNALTFLAGVCYERMVNCTSMFSGFRVNILVHATKASEV